MKILHAADIHYRPLARHQEYRRVFSGFFEQAKRLRPDIILVCGDLLHSKTQISPELIMELSWWFTKLSSIASVHLILGNHDGNLNSNRIDSVSPIVSLINSERLVLYAKSGIYKVTANNESVNLCVFSCFDEEGWKNVKADLDAINIALFHGRIRGAKTDNEYVLGADVPLEYFEGFDFVMAGDVHRHQFLRDHIAYPGSIIQQNHGELSTEKGFLVWDIRDKDDFDVEFHSVKQIKPFITLEWQGSVKKTLAKAKTRNARYRIISDEELSHIDKSHITSELQANLNASSVSWEPSREANQFQAAEAIKAKKINLRDPQELLGLLKGFYEEDTFSDIEWSKVEALVEDNVKGLTKDPVVRNTEWALRRLEWDNTFGYGEGNVIDFDKSQGITGLFAPNWMGKSSVIGTIMYTLFNTTDRGPVKNEKLVNVRKGSCRSKLLFDVSGDDYEIKRKTINKIAKNDLIKSSTSLEFCKVGQSVKTDVKRQETEKEIRKIVGSSEDFLLTAICAAEEMNLFIKKKNTARKAVFSRYLELDVCDQLCEIFKDSSKDIAKEFKKMSEKDWDNVIEDLKKEQKKEGSNVEKLGKQLSKLRKKIEKHKRELEAIPKPEDVVTPKDVLKAEEQVEELNEEIERLKRKKTRAEKEQKEKERELKKLNKTKDFPTEEYKENLNAYEENLSTIRKITSTLVEMRGDLKQAKTILEQKQKSVKKLDLVPCKDEFPDCRFIKDSHEDKKTLSKHKTSVNKLIKKTETTKKKLEGLDEDEIQEKIDEIQEKISKHERNIRKTLTIKAEIERLKGKVSGAEKDGTIAQKELEKAQKKLTEMKEVVVEPTEDDKSSILIDTIRQLNKEENELDRQRMSSASRIGQIKAETEQQKKERDQYQKLRQEWRIYEKLILAFSKKGIPSQIIRSRLPEVNEEIERITSGVAPFKIELEVNEDSNELEILMNEDGDRYPIELCSGAEKKIASLAIRVSLMNISNLPKPDMLFIDEAFDTFDPNNVDLCARMFVALKKWFKNVIIISHNEQVKSIADNLIEIEKVGKDSRIVHE